MQIVDILCDQEQLTSPFGIQSCQRLVSGIGLNRSKLCPPGVVEGVDESGVPAERRGRADILDPVALPQSVGSTEGREAALGRDACAGQYDYVIDVITV